MQALIEHSHGTYAVAPTLMRGPSDILVAMGGATRLPLDLIDSPDVMHRAAELCADVWVEVASAQVALLPESVEGYVAGEHGLCTWAPEKLVWLQEDAMALLSPKLYGEFFLPLDRRIAGAFPCVAFHLHNSALWAIDQLVDVPEIDVVELNLDDIAHSDVEGTFAGWKKIHAHKPLVMWWPYEEDLVSRLRWVLAEFPLSGLSIQTVVKDAEEAKRLRAGFLDAVREL